MNKKIKIIFVDIDWTILDHHKHDFDYPSIEALKQAQKNGYLVYLCTARPYESIKLTGLFNHLTPDGIVCTNGAVTLINDEVLYSENFPNEYVRQIINVANKYGYTLELSTEKERFFTKEGNEYVDSFFGVFAEVRPEIREYKDENVSAILLFSPKENDEILLKEFPQGIGIYRFMDTAADIHYVPAYKDQGIKRILEHLHISKEEAMGIGDDFGDIPMFEIVGTSIAMGNGVEEAKAKATYVTSPISESGLKKALEHFEII